METSVRPPSASAAAREGGEAAPFEMSFPERLSRLAGKPFLDVHVADHCNLRCAGCVHFAPVAEPQLLDLDAFERDLATLSAIPGICGYFESLCLMGGEPTLHPQLPEALRLARRHLPGMPIMLDTNGLLLRRMGDGFWEAMAEADAMLVLSPYPIGVDYRALVALAEGWGVRAALAGDVTGTGRGKEAFFRLALDESGSQDPVHAFNGCPFGGRYLQLHEGALWPCQVAARHGALDSAFGSSLAACDDDRLPLGAIGSTGEIEAFRRRAHAMCRFCANDRLAVAPWGRSRRERGEWFADGAGAES